MKMRNTVLVAYPRAEDTRDNAFFNVGYEFHADSKIDDVVYRGYRQTNSDRFQ